MAITTLALWQKYPDLFNFRGNYKHVNEESIVLVGTPLHKNLGDHLIAEGEKLFLKDTFPNAKLYEIPTEVFLRNFIFLKKRTPAETRVFITGGGWMGDLYPKDEITIHQMMKTFAHCKLTILPQTIYYSNTNDPMLLRNSRAAIDNCRDFKLCTRDEDSYNFAKNNLGMDKLALAPDMGLYFPTDIESEQSAAGICLRNDRERIYSENVDIIKRQLEFEYDIREIDTIAPKNVRYNERIAEIEKALKDFAACPVILT